ncbi:MAG: HNH endonuclease signature motif containing protein [Chloroflexota bacterium]|nr:HNH endonuclease signature motif containing protein [Chloroflexota bacterium]
MSKKRVTADQRRTVIRRARGCCEYCRSQLRFTNQSFSVEHIIPRSRQGETTLDNLALSCQSCSNHKYNKIEGRDPISGKSVPLYHPRQQRWAKHFTWNNDCTLIIGLTPVGRATVEILQLNNLGIANLRRILYAVGEHPPQDCDI